MTTEVKNEKLNVKSASVSELSWTGKAPKLPFKADIKIRYRSESLPAKISKNGSDKTLEIKFKKPAKAVTSGQSAVFYSGQEVLGGGVLC